MSYDLTFNVKDIDGNPLSESDVAISGFVKANAQTFNYTGDVQIVPLVPGFYLIQLWGARGNRSGGFGGYTEGKILVTEETDFYVYVGDGNVATRNPGWPDGGLGGALTVYGGGGGGSTSVRLSASIYDRILVAGGGGGGGVYSTGGVGGGLNGGDSYGTGGTQTEGGVHNGAFGQGGAAAAQRAGAGGGGWFGGGGSSTRYEGGGGGSSYIGDEIEVGEHSFPKFLIEDGLTQSGLRDGKGLAIISEIVPFSGAQETDINGDAVFEDLAPADYSYTVSRVAGYYADQSGTVEVIDQNVLEEVTLLTPELYLTNIGIQADVFEGPIIARITNIALQVELGEYYAVALPLRTKPVPAKARVFPVYSKSRNTGIP